MHNVATWLIPPQYYDIPRLWAYCSYDIISSSSISFERLDGVRAIIIILLLLWYLYIVMIFTCSSMIMQECHDVICLPLPCDYIGSKRYG